MERATSAGNSEAGKIRVLVVDDSAYVRKVVKEMLGRAPDIEVVGTATDGEDALEKVEELRPDVVTLDLIMPRRDGIGFLREQMSRRPIPVVVLSIASESGVMAMAALEAGAVEMIQKPTALASDRIFEVSDELAEKVRIAARASTEKLRRSMTQPIAMPRAAAGKHLVDAVALGLSTGGPQALRRLLSELPADLPVPVLVVIHMPVGYTELFARSLNDVSGLDVREARQNDEIGQGMVLVAPAGRHLTLVPSTLGGFRVHLDARPVDSLHRPSVDVLFESAAAAFGSRLLGVVMTGMGRDGAVGAERIKANGGLVFSEARETSVIYGMPRAVEEAGLSDRVVPLEEMAEAILEVV